MTSTSASRERSERRVVLPRAAVWTLRIGMAVVFLGGGLMKLLGFEVMVSLFADIGLGEWLRYLVGSLEIVGGVVLLVPGWGGVAAIGLIALMIGAGMAQLLIIRRPPLAAAACTVVLMIIVWHLREEMDGLLERITKR